MQRLLVLGGNGYVGQNICRAALDSGKYAVASLSRSGPPSTPNPCLTANSHLMDEIEWMKGDIFDVARRDEAFGGVGPAAALTAVVIPSRCHSRTLARM